MQTVTALKHVLQSWNNRTQSEMHAIDRTVNVINSFPLSR